MHFSTFEDNRGGIECLDGALCEVHDSLLRFNGAEEGGGILVVDSDMANLTIWMRSNGDSRRRHPGDEQQPGCGSMPAALQRGA